MSIDWLLPAAVAGVTLIFLKKTFIKDYSEVVLGKMYVVKATVGLSANDDTLTLNPGDEIMVREIYDYDGKTIISFRMIGRDEVREVEEQRFLTMLRYGYVVEVPDPYGYHEGKTI